MQLIKKKESYKKALKVLKKYHYLPPVEQQEIIKAYENLEENYKPYIRI